MMEWPNEAWDDELIGAYVDGRMQGLMEVRLEEAMAADPALAARVAAQRRLSDRLKTHYAPVEDEPVPDHLLAMLQGAAPAGEKVVSIETARARRAPTRYWVPAALAASLVAGLIGGTFIGGSGGSADPLAVRGELASALDTRLASDGAADAVRIGVTFRNAGGAVCRTFDGAQAGMACREGDTWRLQLLAPGSGAGQADYRQASSGPATVLEAAQAVMAGDPADATEERRLRDGGWR